MISNLSDAQNSLSFKNFNFLSPEQKKAQALSVKCDTYAFGVLAYYLITRDFPEGYFELPSKIAPEYKLNWDLLICKCLQKDYKNRPERLTEAVNTLLSNEISNATSLDVLSWEEVEKKVENAMQMSFEFSPTYDQDKSADSLNTKNDENNRGEPE